LTCGRPAAQAGGWERVAMKTLIFDQYEFENWASEELLEISIAKRHEFAIESLDHFAAIMLRHHNAPLPLPAATRFSSLSTFSEDVRYLRDYAGIPVPDNCDWQCHVISNDRNDRHLIFDLGDLFISMNWSMSA
jgi:hypothetical protein